MVSDGIGPHLPRPCRVRDRGRVRPPSGPRKRLRVERRGRIHSGGFLDTAARLPDHRRATAGQQLGATVPVPRGCFDSDPGPFELRVPPSLRPPWNRPGPPRLLGRLAPSRPIRGNHPSGDDRLLDGVHRLVPSGSLVPCSSSSSPSDFSWYRRGLTVPNDESVGGASQV